MATIPFNSLDEMFVHLDDPTRPLNVHLEVRVDGRLDEERLRQAIRAAVAKHPLARARLQPWSSDAETYEWVVDEEPQIDPLLKSIDGSGAASLDHIRSDLYSRPLTLFESPPFRVLLVHHPDGDIVMLAIHHVASDGIGALRFLQSIARAYAGVADPVVDIDPAEAHRLAVDADGPGVSDRAHNLRVNLQQMVQMRSRAAKLATKDPSHRAGYGVHTLSLPLAPLIASALRGRLHATVNDLLLAGVHRSIDTWNHDNGESAERISITMPVNARPEAWRYDVVANLFTTETVWTDKAQRASPESCLAAVVGWTEAVKRRGTGSALASQARGPRGRVAQRRGLSKFVQASANLMGGTVTVSNLGRVAPDWVGGSGFEVKELWVTPPPVGVSLGIGAMSVGETLRLGLRYSHTVFSTDAAEAFAEVLRNELDLLGAS